MEIRRQLQELRDLQKEERKALSKAMVSAVFFFLGLLFGSKKPRNDKLVGFRRSL